MRNLVIYGSGGLAAGDLTWLIEDINEDKPQWNLLGYLDDSGEEKGKIKKTYEVLGGIEWLQQHKDVYCVLGVGSGLARHRLYEKAKNFAAGFPNLIHPSVQASRHITMGIGNMIFPGNLISGGAELGNHVLINLGCTIGHDAKLMDFSTVSPGAHLSGFVELGSYSDIGTGANVRQLIKIGCNVNIGAGAAVVANIPDNSVAVGVPAKVIKYNAPAEIDEA